MTGTLFLPLHTLCKTYLVKDAYAPGYKTVAISDVVWHKTPILHIEMLFFKLALALLPFAVSASPNAGVSAIPPLSCAIAWAHCM